ncbi:MAG: glycosyltransferase family 2 protein [Gammaproteobacteria bacterium]
MAELVFWLSALLIGYTYAGYPLALAILMRLRSRPVLRSDITPPITVIVAAYNEERSIGAKIADLLAQDYPPGSKEVIIVSDGSIDGTDEIVRQHQASGLRYLRVEDRQGKSAAQNAAAEIAHGEILVFTDATTRLEPGALRRIVRGFADDTVGCVGGKLSYASRGGSGTGAGGESYWRYERSIKRMEGAISSLIGVSGCFYAVRKRLYEKVPPNLISDFAIALMIYEKGYRIIYEEAARCLEETLESGERELSMRIRVALRTYSALWAKRHLLSPARYGLYAFQLISHKVLRYAVPLLLIALFVSNLTLRGEPLYTLAFIVQATGYASALAGWVLQGRGPAGNLLNKPYYFVLANLAALIALLRFVRGQEMVVWTPVR